MPPSLASRLLFHASPTPPPDLLVAKNLPPELNHELYDFIALALRAFVQPWWSKISRYDKDFLPHITQILVVVTRSLEARAQGVDLPDLVFHDIPAIVTQHYNDYRNVAGKTCTSYASGGAASLPILFANLQPHMAISPEGVLDAEYYRQIIDHILKVCLPPEDFEPEAERFIIREVLVKVVLEDIFPKVTQPWFIYKILLDVMYSSDEATFKSKPPDTSPSAQTQSFSFHNVIVVVLSAVQAISGASLTLIHAYKQAITTIKLVQQSPPRTPQPPDAHQPTSTKSVEVPSEVLDETSRASKVLQAPSLKSIPSSKSSFSKQHGRAPSSTYSATATTAPAQTQDTSSIPHVSGSQSTPSHTSSAQQQHPSTYHANYAFSPLFLLSTIFTFSNRLASSALYNTLCLIFALFTPFLDKLLPHMLYTFLSPTFILNTARTAKKTLFPNGYPGPPPVEPTPEEQAEMKRRLESWRGSGGVALAIPSILGPDPSTTIGAALDPLSDAQCNKRLIVFLLDRVLVALFPELVGGEDSGTSGGMTPPTTISRSPSAQ